MTVAFGNIKDAGFDPLYDQNLVLYFIPSGVATDGGSLGYSATRLRRTPDEAGDWEIDLKDVREVRQEDFHYRFEIHSLDRYGAGPVTEYPSLKLYPTGDRIGFGQMAGGARLNSRFVFYQPTEPDTWVPGDRWVNTATGKILENRD
jgi:hypothetical protein